MGKVGKVIVGGILIVGGVAIGLATGQWGLAAVVMSQGAGMVWNSIQGDRSLSERQGFGLGNRSDSKAGIPIIYGETRIGPVIVDVRVDENYSTDSKRLVIVCAWAHGSQDGTGIQGIDKIWFDTQLAWTAGGGVQSPFDQTVYFDSYQTEHLKVTNYLGTDAQVVDPDLNAIFPTEWPSASAGKGVAYSVLMLWFNEDIYGSGLPRINAEIRGMKVFDPRTSTTAYSKNPILCIRDFITADVYGFDDTIPDETTWEDEADYCDELVTPYSGFGTQKRFELSGWTDSSQSIQSTLADLATSCRATVLHIGGEWKVVIRKAKSNTGLTLTPDNTIEGSWKYRLPGSSDIPNSVSANYIEPDRSHQVDTVHWPEPSASNTYLAEDQNYPHQIQIDLPFTDNRLRAQQIAMVVLQEARNSIAVQLTAKEEMLQLEVGDLVYVTHPSPDWDQKQFWVAATNYRPFESVVDLMLIEYQSTAYDVDDEQEAQPTIEYVNPPTPYPPNPPESLELDAGDPEATTFGGIRTPRIKMSWAAAPDPYLYQYEIQAKRNSDSEWDSYGTATKDDTEFYIGPVDNNVYWDVRIRALNRLGQRSDWIQNSITPNVTGTGVSFPDSLEIEGVAPALVFNESDQSSPNGLWRWQLQNNAARLQKNTSVSGEFATYDEYVTVNADGSISLAGGNFDINASGQVTQGNWLAGVILEQYGGTGHSSWNAGGLVYADGATSLVDTGAGQAGAVAWNVDGTDWASLQAPASGTYYLRSVDRSFSWASMSAGSLNDLTDVTISSPQTNEYLVKSAGDWINTDLDVLDSTPGADDTFLMTISGSVQWSGSHDIISAHDASGLTIGHFMKATGSTTFAFQAHGLTYSDVGAAASAHTHDANDWTAGTWTQYGVVYATSATALTTTAAASTGALLRSTDGTSWSVLAAGTNSHVLTMVAGQPAWAASAGGGALDDLSDVTISSPQTNEYIVKSAGDWINTDLDVLDSVEGADDTVFMTRSGAVAWTTLIADDIPDLSATYAPLNHAYTVHTGTIPSSDVSGSYTGITAVGTLTGGTWNATAIGAAYGGLGSDFTDVFNMITGTPGGSSWQSLAHPNTGTNKYLQASGSGGTRSIGWVDAPAGTIGGTVSSPYVPYASAADTLADSELRRQSSTTLIWEGTQMTVQPTGSLNQGTYRAYTYHDSNQYARFDMYAARGSKTTPTAVNQNLLGLIGFWGYSGSQHQEGAYIGAYATQTWSGETCPTQLRFCTRASGDTTWNTRWIIGTTGTLYPNTALDLGATGNRLSVIYTNEINADNGGPTDPSYMFNSSTTTGMYYYSPGVAFTDAETLAMSVTSSRTKIHSSKLLIDDGDATIADGEIGLSESGGTFYMSGRDAMIFEASNNDASPTSGYTWRAGTPPSNYMTLMHNATLGNWALDVPQGYVFAPFYFVGNNTGVSNLCYIDFRENDGTRQGYVGIASGTDDNLHIYSDTGDVTMTGAGAGGVVRVNDNFEVLGSVHEFINNKTGPGAVDYYLYGIESAGTEINFRRAQTSYNSPSTIPSSAGLGSIVWQGYDGSAYAEGARIRAVSNAAFTTSEHSTVLYFATRDGSGALTDRWYIADWGALAPNSDGTVDIGGQNQEVRDIYVSRYIDFDNSGTRFGYTRNIFTGSENIGNWFRVAENTGSHGRGGCDLIIWGAGGSTTAATYEFKISSNWNDHGAIVMTCGTPGAGFEITAVRLVYDSSSGVENKYIDVFVNADHDTNMGVTIINNEKMYGYVWTEVPWYNMGSGGVGSLSGFENETLVAQFTIAPSGGGDYAVFGVASSDIASNNDIFRVWDNGNVTIYGDISFSGTFNQSIVIDAGASNPSYLSITSLADAYILIDADSDNVSESDNAYIRMQQDDNAVWFVLGTTGGAGVDPQGTAVTGTLDNSIYLGTTCTLSALQFATNGAVLMTLRHDNPRVGINDTSPDYTLDVGGTIQAQTDLRVGGDLYMGDDIFLDSSGQIRFDENDQDQFFFYHTLYDEVIWMSKGASGAAFAVYNSTDADWLLRVNFEGRLFIGESNSAAGVPDITWEDDQSMGFRRSAADDIRVVTSSSDCWEFTESGHLIPIGTRYLGGTGNFINRIYVTGIRGANGSNSAPVYTFNNNTDVGMYYTGSALGFAVDNTTGPYGGPPLTLGSTVALFDGVGVYSYEKDWGDRNTATTVEFSDSNNHYMRLTGNVTITIGTSMNGKKGAEMVVSVGCDSSGPRTITWSGVDDWATAEDNTVSSLSTNVYTFKYINDSIVGWVSSSDTIGAV